MSVYYLVVYLSNSSYLMLTILSLSLVIFPFKEIESTTLLALILQRLSYILVFLFVEVRFFKDKFLWAPNSASLWSNESRYSSEMVLYLLQGVFANCWPNIELGRLRIVNIYFIYVRHITSDKVHSTRGSGEEKSCETPISSQAIYLRWWYFWEIQGYFSPKGRY